ncbi:hypothetical protein JCM1840_004839 [Sporobolomyces johnsonii]
MQPHLPPSPPPPSSSSTSPDASSRPANPPSQPSPSQSPTLPTHYDLDPLEFSYTQREWQDRYDNALEVMAMWDDPMFDHLRARPAANVQVGTSGVMNGGATNSLNSAPGPSHPAVVASATEAQLEGQPGTLADAGADNGDGADEGSQLVSSDSG